ncbi:hypothetical protein TREES_T100003330 [Tupaia chinensis]|uniref:Uncharacterized protein n=1 Tax=Tupaia chinensis TaxID=246437 RepID=L9JG62_TUPCH|nr:hypothetical protein TREES_T100003330 [Tupaia chinensis]
MPCLSTSQLASLWNDHLATTIITSQEAFLVEMALSGVHEHETPKVPGLTVGCYWFSTSRGLCLELHSQQRMAIPFRPHLDQERFVAKALLR